MPKGRGPFSLGRGPKSLGFTGASGTNRTGSVHRYLFPETVDHADEGRPVGVRFGKVPQLAGEVRENAPFRSRSEDVKAGRR
jgi:hypothetical protein